MATTEPVGPSAEELQADEMAARFLKDRVELEVDKLFRARHCPPTRCFMFTFDSKNEFVYASPGIDPLVPSRLYFPAASGRLRHADSELKCVQFLFLRRG